MGMFNAIDIAGSGMTAERLRLDVVSNNLANVNTTRTVNGTPYRRQIVVFEPRASFEDILNDSMQEPSMIPDFKLPAKKSSQTEANIKQVGQGVRAAALVEDESPFRMLYEPGHPDANEQGYVQLPNVNVVAEMLDMLSASRAYEANIASISTAKTMAMKALEMGK